MKNGEVFARALSRHSTSVADACLVIWRLIITHPVKAAGILRKLIKPLALAVSIVCTQNSFALTTPGATPGSFSVSESGAASYSLPLAVPPGTAGMEPKLSLNYTSQGGNDVVGVGWSLSGLSAVNRCAKTLILDGVNRGVQFDANDRYCLDGQRLIMVNGGVYGAVGAEYRTEMESFTRVVSYGGVVGDPQYFKAWTKSGQIIEFGNTADSRAEAQGKTQAAVWTVNQISDTKSNYLSFTYTEDNANGEQRIARIDYTGNSATGLVASNRVEFSYAPRTVNSAVSYVGGSKSQLTQRLTAITSWVNTSTPARSYALSYAVEGDFLSSVQECDGAGTCVNPTAFTWQFPSGGGAYPGPGEVVAGLDLSQSWFSTSGDVNADGYDDLLSVETESDLISHVYLRVASGNSAVFSSRIQIATTPLRDCSIAPNCEVNSQVATPGNIYYSPYARSPSRISLLGDVNADGKADLILGDGRVAISNGNGSFGVPYAANAQLGNAPFASARDVNGDGRADLMFGRAEADNLTHYYIQYAQADGSFGTPQAIATAPLKTRRDHLAPCAATLGDFNADGRADLVTCEFKIYPATDSGFASPIATGFILPPDISPGSAPGALFAGDTDGNGLPELWYAVEDLLYITDVAQWDGQNFTDGRAPQYSWPSLTFQTMTVGAYSGKGQADVTRTIYASPGIMPPLLYYRAQTQPNSAITAITNGLGATQTFTYKPISDPAVYTPATGAAFPERELQTAAPFYVVDSTVADDGAVGSYRMNYRYEAARTNYYRGLVGFRAVIATDPQTGLVNRTEYRQDYPFTGMPARATTNSAGGVELNRTENTYAQKAIPGGGLFPYLAYTKTQSRDLNGTTLPFTETWNETFDDWGNATKITVKTSDGFTTWTNNVYTNDAAKWLLGRLTRATVAKSVNGGAAQTRTSAFAYDAVSGLLTQETIEPDQPALRLITDTVYDAYGNKTRTTVSGGDAVAGTAITARSTSTTYDSKGRFPLTTTNALGHTETRVFDERFGLVKSLVGPNALTTTWAYDGFGRKTQEVRADATQSNWSYADCVSACGFAKYTITSSNSGTTPVTTFYDKLNRAVRSVGTGFDGQTIYSDTEYDAQGRVKRSSRPYFAGAAVYWTSPTYDDLGRTTRVDLPDGTFSTMAYNGLTTVATNPKGQTKTELKNSQGQAVSVTDNVGGITSYTYDPFGNVRNITNSGTFTAYNNYDLRGRKTQGYSPDMGWWYYAYNALGELIKQTDARAQVTTLSYDLLGRIKTRNEPGMRSTWTYDTAVKGIGKLASVVASGTSVIGTAVVKTYGYDALGRNTRMTTDVDGKTFNQDTSYDSLGRVLVDTRPSGFATRNIYNAAGYQTELRNADAGNALLWKAISIDAEGRITQTQYGNGVVNTKTWQAQNGRLTSIQANAPNSTVLLQNQHFTYDSLANLTGRTDTLTSGGRTETFQYDSLNRLTQADLTLSGVVQAPVIQTYNAIGNLTSKTGVGAYTYHTSQIHAVISAGSNTYTYDANGNMISGGGRNITWTAWNMPIAVTYGGATTVWSYDADHARSIQIAGAKTTYYLNPRADLGGHYEEAHYTGGRIDKIHGLYAGGQLIGQITTTNQAGVPTKTRYFHSDQLGSISLVTNESGAVSARYTFDAWGKRQTVVGSEELHHGFTGHEHLDDGLVHMNGRMYDPVLGRFISADPYIQDASDGQAFNRYSYVSNNPLSYTDPSGYFKLRHFLNPFKSRESFIRTHFPGHEYRNNPYVRLVGAAVASYFTFGLAGGGFYGAVASGFVGGTIATGTIQGGIQGAFTGALFFGAGELGTYFNLAEKGVGRALLHAGAGCISASASGGDCGTGAATAGFTQFAASNINVGSSVATNIIKYSVIGGTASVIGGGKFVNGAQTGAFQYLFNCVAHKCYELQNPEGGLLAFTGSSGSGYFGRPETLSAVYDVEWLWSSAGERSRIEINELSLEIGPTPGHSTHQDGQDVDIRPMRTGGSGAVTFKSQNYDRAATQRLIDTIRTVSPNSTIYFNDPSVNGVQYFKGHDNHIHVRFK